MVDLCLIMINHRLKDIKREFNTSKNYFKMTLGGLMREKLITQDKEGTRLL